MSKHIIIQAIYQLVIMCAIVFFGSEFLPEELDETLHGNPNNKRFGDVLMVYNGRIGAKERPILDNGIPTGEYAENYSGHDSSRHFTYGFNIFVMMQIFNFINARKIDDSFNTFEGILDSSLFMIIVGAIFILQFIIITFGYIAFKVAWLVY